MRLRRDTRLGLRVWLFLLTLVALLPLLGLGAYTIIQVERDQQRITAADLTQRSNGILRAVEVRLRTAASTLTTLAESDAVRHEDWLGLYIQARRVLENNPEFRAITLADRHNQLVFHTTLPFGPPPFPAQAQASLLASFESGQVGLSEPFTAPLSPASVVAVTVPLAHGTQAQYALRVIILTDGLSDLLADRGLPRGWVASLVDHHGTVVAHSQDAGQFVGRGLAPVHLAALMRKERGIYAGPGPKGEPSTYLLQPVFQGQWYLSLGVLNEVLQAPVQSSLRNLLILALLTIGVSFLLSQWMARSLVAQATRLVRVAGGIGSADAATQPLGVREFDDLRQGLVSTRAHQALTQGHLINALGERDEVRDLYDRAPCGYHSLDCEGRVVMVNQTELDWLGRNRESVVGHPFTEFLTPDSQRLFAEHFPRFLAQGEVRDLEFELLRQDGTVLPIMLSATAVRDAQGQFLMSRSSMFDLTERKKLEARLDHMARTDMLTGLSNRLDFYEHAEREIARCQRFQLPMALLMFDIDRFKNINDTYGHASGDEVLKSLARVCGEEVRDIDVLSHIGGEEFALLLPQTELAAAMEVAQRLRLRLSSTPILIKTAEPLHITVSIGVTPYLPEDRSVDDLLKRADLAMYQAKHEGRDRVRVQV